MKNKGFTLIELLAVIVILAIIALIAVPIILNIIGDTKESSDLRSAELYLDAVEKAVARKNLTGEFNPTSCDVITSETKSSIAGSKEGDLNCDGTLVKVDIDGEVPAGGSITFSNGKINTVTNLHISNKYFNKTSSSSEMTASDTQQEVEVSFTGTIYRNTSQPIYINDSIVPGEKSVYCLVIESMDMNSCDNGYYLNDIGSCQAAVAEFEENGMEGGTCGNSQVKTGLTPGSYYTNENHFNIVGDYYLKHEVVDNIVTESYVCFKYSDEEDAACIQGGVPEEYEANVTEVEKTRSYFESNGGSCNIGSEDFNCSASEIGSFTASVDGDAQFYISSTNFRCNVSYDGRAACEYVD